ncbi:MAG: radical SAM protein [Candidatus Rokubacteria bacterium]|nr:radical SAM protein [Candidatus Rokubacteria bacterium]
MFLEACAQNAGLGEPSLAELIALKAEARRVPLNAHLELTYRCNEQCVHCYCVVEHGKEREARARELTTAEIVRVLDDLAELGGLYLTLSGGEVLVRPDFFEIAAHARKAGFAYRIYTNGIGLNASRIERLAALEPLTVELSIFSADAAVHDGITRVPGSFDRLMRNVALLKAHGLRVYLKSVMMKPNIAGFADLHRLGRELGVFTHIFACEVSPRIDGPILKPRQYQLDENELVDYLGQSVLPATEPLFEGASEDIAKQRDTCGPAVNSCCIDPYGNVYPCVAFRVPLGNVREKPLRELWYAPPPAIQDLLSVKKYEDLTECSSCELIGFCKRCHGDNLLERGGSDWKSCHPHARTFASAQRRVYQIQKAGRPS